MSTETLRRSESAPLPHALQERPLLEQALGDSALFICLDYDGTLSPIVARPEDAQLEPSVRKAVRDIAARYPTAIISGRELHDVRTRVGLSQLYYAGNHGFEIAGPEGSGIAWEFGRDFIDEIDDFYQACALELPPVEGLIVEHKHYSLSVHYRLVADEQVPPLETALTTLLAQHPRLRLRQGKQVFEVRPAADWHKGKAVRHLLELAEHQEIKPIFIGDDMTDEDAFEEIQDFGLGILVSRHERPTAATFRVADTCEVRDLLGYLIDR